MLVFLRLAFAHTSGLEYAQFLGKTPESKAF